MSVFNIFWPVTLALLPSVSDWQGHDSRLRGTANSNEIEVTEELEGTVTEDFDGKAKISSPVIAGLIAGPLLSTVDFSKLRLYLPGSRSRQKICYAATTRDGVYSASARDGVLFAKPESVAVRPRYDPAKQGRLRTYDIEDVAIRARYGARCETDVNAPLLPASYTSGRTSLTIMLNSRRSRSASVELTDSRGRSSLSACTRDRQKSSVRFDMICSVSLKGLTLSGISQLKITMRNRRGGQFVEKAKILW